MSLSALPAGLLTPHMVLPWVIAPVGGALIGLVIGSGAARLMLRRGTAARLMASLTAGLLEMPIADLGPGAREIANTAVRAAVEAAIRSLISSPRFLHEIRQSVSGIVASIWSLPMADVLARINARGFVLDRLLPALSGEESRGTIARAAGAAAGESVATLASDNALQSVSHLLNRLLPTVVERVIEWLESADMRNTMAIRGRELLPRILERLNLVQRFLLSAGQFDRRIDEKMPEIVSETLEALERVLRDPAQQGAIRDAMIRALRDWRESKESGTDVSLLVSGLVDGFLAGLKEPSARQSTYLSLEALLTGGGGQTLGAVLRQRLGLEDRVIADSLANEALAWLSRPAACSSVSAWVAERVSGFLGEKSAVPLAQVLSIDPGRKQRIDAFLTQAAFRMASTRSSRVARWAGGLGAVLGLLIGLLEDVLRLLGIA